MDNFKLKSILLGMNGKADRPNGTWTWARKGITMVVHALYPDEVRELKKLATKLQSVGKGKEPIEFIDLEEFNRLFLLKALTVEPGAPWADPEVLKHFGVAEAVDLFDQVFLSGEYGALLNCAQELSGVNQVATPEEQVLDSSSPTQNPD